MADLADFHSHLIPGVDDGARDLDEARAALRALRDQGFRSLITTPHLDGSLTRDADALAARLAGFDAGWQQLETMARAEFPDLTLRRGAEIMLDTPDPDLSDPRVRLGGTPFVLVEFPHMIVPPRSSEALAHIARQGWTPIVAHPERYGSMLHQTQLAGEWRSAGAFLQGNHASLLGRYSPDARKVLLRLLERGWIDYLCTDYHAHGKPIADACRAALLELGAEEQAQLLMEINPRRLIAGQAPIPIAPLQLRRSLWRRVADTFGGR